MQVHWQGELTNDGKETTGDGGTSDETKDDDSEKSSCVFASDSGERVQRLGRHDGLLMSGVSLDKLKIWRCVEDQVAKVVVPAALPARKRERTAWSLCVLASQEPGGVGGQTRSGTYLSPCGLRPRILCEEAERDLPCAHHALAEYVPNRLVWPSRKIHGVFSRAVFLTF